MEQIGYITFGWLLGILAPAITEYIRRKHRIKLLKCALSLELSEIKFLMASAAFDLYDYCDSLDNELINWFEVVLLEYEGNEPTNSYKDLLHKLKQTPPYLRSALTYPNGTEGIGLFLLSHETYLLNAHINEIALMPLDYQKWLLNIKKNINIYNQNVEDLKNKSATTFNSLTDNDRNKVFANIQNGYMELAKRSELIVNLIAQQK